MFSVLFLCAKNGYEYHKRFLEFDLGMASSKNGPFLWIKKIPAPLWTYNSFSDKNCLYMQTKRSYGTGRYPSYPAPYHCPLCVFSLPGGGDHTEWTLRTSRETLLSLPFSAQGEPWLLFGFRIREPHGSALAFLCGLVPYTDSSCLLFWYSKIYNGSSPNKFKMHVQNRCGCESKIISWRKLIINRGGS